ncbi:MAG TPA: hypothetical protein PKM69_09085, partial [Bacteroidales bacterium]|nr:hypothetical protein [Bacteroidales bacterium]
AIDKTPKCSKYYVISDALNVQYICSAKSFGVAKLDKRIEKEGYKTSNEALNKEAFLQQRVITAGNGNDVENAKMIASYFPLLLKNQNS